MRPIQRGNEPGSVPRSCDVERQSRDEQPLGPGQANVRLVRMVSQTGRFEAYQQVSQPAAEFLLVDGHDERRTAGDDSRRQRRHHLRAATTSALDA